MEKKINTWQIVIDGTENGTQESSIDDLYSDLFYLYGI